MEKINKQAAESRERMKKLLTEDGYSECEAVCVTSNIYRLGFDDALKFVCEAATETRERYMNEPFTKIETA